MNAVLDAEYSSPNSIDPVEDFVSLYSARFNPQSNKKDPISVFCSS